jgi:hypothetical protein
MKWRYLALSATLFLSCAQKEDVSSNARAPIVEEETRFVTMGTSGMLAPGNGDAIVSSYCVTCHSPDLIRQQRLTAKQWTATVEKMEKWGAAVPENERAALLSYLSRNYGPGNHFVPFETSPAPVGATLTLSK